MRGGLYTHGGLESANGGVSGKEETQPRGRAMLRESRRVICRSLRGIELQSH